METSKKTNPKDIKKVITSFEAALAYNGVSSEEFEKSTAFDTDDEKAYKKLKQIVLALNEGESLKYDGRTWLYYPWFSVGSGVGFSYYDYCYDYSRSCVGSRLCFKNRELAIYAGKQFTAIYEAYLNG